MTPAAPPEFTRRRVRCDTGPAAPLVPFRPQRIFGVSEGIKDDTVMPLRCADCDANVWYRWNGRAYEPRLHAVGESIRIGGEPGRRSTLFANPRPRPARLAGPGRRPRAGAGVLRDDGRAVRVERGRLRSPRGVTAAVRMEGARLRVASFAMPFPELTAYFTAEKHGGLLLIALAVASVALAIYLFATKSLFSAMAWPMLVLGGIELVIGATVAGRAASQIAEIEAGLQSKRTLTSPPRSSGWRGSTAPSILIKKVEIALIAVSILFVIVRPAPDTLGALGLGILLQSAVLLVFDTFAHHRAVHYVEWLIALPPGTGGR